MRVSNARDNPETLIDPSGYMFAYPYNGASYIPYAISSSQSDYGYWGNWNTQQWAQAWGQIWAGKLPNPKLSFPQWVMKYHWRDVLSLTLPYALAEAEPILGIVAYNVIQSISDANDALGLHMDAQALVNDLYQNNQKGVLSDSLALGSDGAQFVWGHLSTDQKVSVIISSAGWIGLDGITAGGAQEVSDDIDTIVWAGNFQYDYSSWLSQYASYSNSMT